MELLVEQIRLVNAAAAAGSCWGSQYSLTPDQESNVAKRYAAGESSADIASSYGLTAVTGLVTLRRLGVPIRDRADASRKVTPDVDAVIAQRCERSGIAVIGDHRKPT